MSDDVFEALTGATSPALTVVTTCAEGVQAGCLVGFQSQGSMSPHHYSVWISKANHTYRTMLRATHVAVHFLAAADNDIELAERFGTTSGDDVDKFAGLDVEVGPGGVPLLTALPHRLAGRRTAVLDVGGDHVCVCLEVDYAATTGDLHVLRILDVPHLQPAHDAQERAVTP